MNNQKDTFKNQGKEVYCGRYTIIDQKADR